MTKNIFNSKLGITIFRYLIKSIILSLICFCTLYSIGFAFAYNSNKNHKANINTMSNSLKNELDVFIKENNISSLTVDKLDEITNKYTDIELQIIKDDKLIYSYNDLDFDEVLLNSSQRVYSSLDDEEIEKIFTLNLSDSSTTALIKDKYEDFLPAFFTIISAIISIIFFIITFTRLLNKKVNYINTLENSIHILEGGNLDYKISIEGDDELSSLALSINNLGSAMKERINGELLAQKSNKELITNVSHDIRTPLTPIIGYLTLLIENNNLSDEQKNKFLDITLSKATQLKKRIDLLFEYSILSSEDKQLNFQRINLRDLVDQFLFESSLLLEKNNFNIKISNSTNVDLFGYIDVDQINRVFDNVISNIIKYANNDFDIIINIDRCDSNFYINISNTINHDCSYAESTGLGINICKTIMKLHNGDFISNTTSNSFETTVVIPISK